MNHKYDNSERLETVSDKQWREALDEVTAYLRWRLAGKTKCGAHSEQELGRQALDYYQEEAVVKLMCWSCAAKGGDYSAKAWPELQRVRHIGR